MATSTCTFSAYTSSQTKCTLYFKVNCLWKFWKLGYSALHGIRDLLLHKNFVQNSSLPNTIQIVGARSKCCTSRVDLSFIRWLVFPQTSSLLLCPWPFVCVPHAYLGETTDTCWNQLPLHFCFHTAQISKLNNCTQVFSNISVQERQHFVKYFASPCGFQLFSIQQKSWNITMPPVFAYIWVLARQRSVKSFAYPCVLGLSSIQVKYWQ